MASKNKKLPFSRKSFNKPNGASYIKMWMHVSTYMYAGITYIYIYIYIKWLYPYMSMYMYVDLHL